MTATLRKLVTAASALALLTALPVQAQTPVRVHVPQGIRSGFTIVEPGPDAAHKYVVIEDVVIHNPTGSVAAYKATDFSLLVGGIRYHPVVRPGMGAVDIAHDGVLGPRDAIHGDLAFLVPADVSRGDLEFFPANWIDVFGHTAGYCCLP